MPTLAALRAEAAACTRCPLFEGATQTVFGQGPERAAVVMVGEQPGDHEDQQGRPFVGPAGGVLDRALAEAGVARDAVYLTNAVKHFKWTPRGKRRIHQTPNQTEVVACRPWLEAELVAIGPQMVVLMGAVAAKDVLGSGFRVTKQHGVVIAASLGEWSGEVVATTHPSAILRAPDAAARDASFAEMVSDLRVVRERVGAQVVGGVRLTEQ
jgi:DNA polymerase